MAKQHRSNPPPTIDAGKFIEGYEAIGRQLDAEPRSEDNMAAAFGLWLGYPLLVEAVACNFSGAEKSYTWDAFDFAHRKAVRAIMILLERDGLDSAPVHRSAEICRRLFHKHDGPLPRWDWQKDTWPDCVSEDEVTAEEYALIHAAHALVSRFDARSAAEPTTVAGQQAAVLKVLRARHPIRLTVAQIAEQLRLSDQSIGDYLLELEKAKLVTPATGKTGRALTAIGLELAKTLPDNAGAEHFRPTP